MQRVVVITRAEPILTVEEMKQHLRVDHDDDDTLIAVLIAGATSHIDGPDGWLGRAIGVQTLEAGLDGFVYDPIPLPFPPAIEIESIEYDDMWGIERTLDPAQYELRDDAVGTAWGTTWPGTRAYRWPSRSVRVRYRAGYAEVPAAIRVAIMMMVSDMYRYRGTAVGTGSAIEVSTPVAMLLQPFRIFAA